MANTRKPRQAKADHSPMPEAEPTRQATRSKRASAAANGISDQMRRHMIAEAAYFRAERREFTPGFDIDDWLAAERAVDELLAAPRLQ